VDYLILKYLHIISATILFGTGLGTAFFKFLADRSNNIDVISITNKNVVLADWLFTTPSILIQILTGTVMILEGNDELLNTILNSSWLLTSIILFIIAGLCWIPVVIIQIKMSQLANSARMKHKPLPSLYWYYTKVWFYLGIPAFISVLVIFFLMSNKPQLF